MGVVGRPLLRAAGLVTTCMDRRRERAATDDEELM